MEKRALLVIMGVSGAGKSAVGSALARELGVAFLEGDSLHTPASVAKMAAGSALEDADRGPWLARVGEWLLKHDASGGVAACSALRRSYRELLREAAPRVRFVQLAVDAAVLARRLAVRRDHFMPSSLLASQLGTLEPLEADEPGFTVAAGTRDAQSVTREIARKIAAGP